jgi:hypothetical protein
MQLIVTFIISYKIIHIIPVRKMFYNAYILPHLDYCFIIYGNCTSFLEEVLKESCKTNSRQRLWHSIWWPIFWNPLDDLFTEGSFQKAIMMFKIMNNQALSYFLNNFILSSYVHTPFCVHHLIFNFTPLDQILNNFLSLL